MPYAATRKRFFDLLPDWLIGAFCLAIPALYNSFPLLTSDSGAYIGNGFELQLPLDRPLLYSIFILISSLGITLWGVVAAQVLILSVLMQFLAARLLGTTYSSLRFAAVTLLIGVATTAGWFAGQIMPDIFTAILLLSIMVLWMRPEERWKRWLLYALMLCCIMVHNSNLLIALITGLLLLFYSIRKKEQHLKTTALALLITGAAGWLSMSAMSSIAGRPFSPSSASHVFLMSRMVENGIMDDFLDEYCPIDSPSYKLCQYKDHLPNRQWDFMWDTTGALYQTGGWQANEEEYGRIIRKTLLTPKYLCLHIVKAMHATFRQLPLIHVGDGLQKFDPESSPQLALRYHYRDEENDYLSSNQQNDHLNLENWNMLIVVFCLLSLVAALLIRPKNNETQSKSMVVLVALCILFLMVNAFVTATLATVIGRYEARVFWILPFLSTLQLIRCLDREKNPAAA